MGLKALLVLAFLLGCVATIGWAWRKPASWWRAKDQPLSLQAWMVMTRTGFAWFGGMLTSMALVLGGDELSRLLHLPVEVLLFVEAVAVLLLISVVFFSRPRFLMPPGYLKAERERRGGRSGRARD